MVVSEGQAVRFVPGEYQTGANRHARVAVVLAIVAPTGRDAVRMPLDCPDCGEGSRRSDRTARCGSPVRTAVESSQPAAVGPVVERRCWLRLAAPGAKRSSSAPTGGPNLPSHGGVRERGTGPGPGATPRRRRADTRRHRGRTRWPRAAPRSGRRGGGSSLGSPRSDGSTRATGCRTAAGHRRSRA